MFVEPCQASGLRRQPHVLQRQRLPHQRAALHPDVAELRLDIFDNAIIGCGGGAENRHVVGHEPQDVDQTPVIRAEVMAPVRDAVRLVHDQQADAAGNGQEHVFDEGVVGQAFGRDQQRVGRIVVDGFLQSRPVFPVRGVDAHRLDAQTSGSLNLVAHQCQEGRDDQGRTAPVITENPGGNEVDGALAPSGPLDHQ